MQHRNTLGLLVLLALGCAGSPKHDATSSAESVTASGAGKRAVGKFKMCINREGKVKSLHMLKSTGHAKYDANIQRKMWQWTYRPYIVDGKPVPVCTTVTFVYRPECTIPATPENPYPCDEPDEVGQPPENSAQKNSIRSRSTPVLLRKVR